MMLSHPRLRLALLHASMLVAPALLVAPGVALAQGLAPNAAPQGGQVVGGAASIGQTTAATTITQSTNRAVIDWRSFDVGREHTVRFQQPSAQSMTLNRVTGPNPSVIAGRVTANGGIALVNQSGVVFTGGAQVQAQSVIVSTNDIGNGAFMRGGAMVFDRPGKPGARIENRGTITAAQAGIAALVAPQVANSGVIAAKLGTVVLAGATQQVIDLNGDGLVSFAVGAPVKRAPADGKALVSNAGTLRAEGGTVLLTAAAADQVVQNLVRAGGTISADTDATSGRTGRVMLSGTGGSIIVEGGVSAAGRAPGTRGGSVTVQADRVLVAGTARVDASGRAGGGHVAIGTNGGRLAERVGVATGAVLRADAGERGDGGRVVVNSRDTTVMAGRISARGGAEAGNGGVVEVSGGHGFQLTGQIDVSAAAGVIGSVIIDPTFLTIVADGDSRINVTGADLSTLILASGAAPDDAYLAAGVVGGITGNLTLQATSTITVGAAITKPLGDLLLQSGDTLAINAPVTLGAGNLVLSALTIAINDRVQVSTANQVYLDTGGSFSSTSSVIEAGAGVIVAGTLTQNGTTTFGTITLGGDNAVGQIGSLSSFGVITFNDTRSLGISGGVYGNGGVSIDVRGGDLAVDGQIGANWPVQLRASGNITVGSTGGINSSDLLLAAGFDFTAGTADIAGAGSITLAGLLVAQTEVSPGALVFAAGTGGITQTGGYISGGTLTVQSGGDVTLASALPWDGAYAAYSSNRITAIGSSRVVGNFTVDSYSYNFFGSYDPSQDIALDGAISVGGTLSLRGEETGFIQSAGSVIGAAQLNATAVDFGALNLGGDNQLTGLGTLAGAGITVRNMSDLAVAGPVSSTGLVSVSVAAGDLTVGGLVSGIDAPVALNASGSLIVQAGGTITASGASSASAIILQAASPDSGYDPSLPGGMTLAGVVSTPGAVTIGAGTGGITQTGGQITTSLLSVASGGQALLDGASPANAVTVLRAVTATGDFVLDNGTTDLVVGGPVTAANIRLRTTGALGLSRYCPPIIVTACVAPPATLNAGTGVVALEAGTLLAFALPGNSATGGMIEIAPSLAESLLVGAAAGTTVAGALSVNQDVLGALTATTLRLGATTAGGTTATTVQFVSALTFAGTLDLHSTGDITQDSKAALAVGTLTGIAGGAIALTEPTNGIGTVGDLSAVGDLSLTVSGTMTLAGLLAAPGQTASLIGPSGIVETGAGRIVAGTLEAQSGGAITLGGANQVASLGGSSAGGSFTLVDGVDLGVVAGETVLAGGALSLTTTGSLSIAGTLDAPSVVLAAGTGMDEAAGVGVIITPLLAASSTAGDIALIADNQINALGAIATPGRFLLVDGVGLLSVGAGTVVRGDSGIVLQVTGALALDGTLLAAGSSVNIVGVTSLTEGAGGSVQTGQLRLIATDGDVMLTGANQVSQLGQSSATGNFFMNDDAALTVQAGATVFATGTLSLATTAGLTLAGTLDAGSVLLAGAAGISQTGGAIITPLLVANSSGGGVALGGTNQVDALGSSQALGDFTLSDTVALTVPAGATVTAGGTLGLFTDSSLTVAGQLDGASVLLAASTGIGETGEGAIGAGSLTLSSTSGDILLDGANQVDVLDSVTTPGRLVFNDTATTVTVPAGHVIGAAGGITLSAPGALALDGLLVADGVTVDIGAGSVSQGVNGGITAAVLTARATTGDLLLGGANQVGTLGAMTATGDLTFNNVLALAVGPGDTILAGGTLTLSTDQALTITGTLDAASVVLAGGTGIAESGGGAILTPLLAASSGGGDIVLGGDNRVDALGTASTPGRFMLTDHVPGLRIAAGETVSAGGGISLVLDGALLIEGTLDGASAAVDIASAGLTEGAADITEDGGGRIIAGLLTVRANAGDIVLGGANAVATLGDNATPGTFTLNNTIALNVPGDGVVRAGGTALITGGADIIVDGHVEGGTLQLQAAGLLQVNGSSAIATAGPLVLAGRRVVTTGLFGSPAGITVDADSASLGGPASGPSLVVSSPDVGFTGLDAAGTQVTLFLGSTGTATGTLDAAGLVVAGGAGATLFGSLAGVAGEAAAPLGVRADDEGKAFPPPPPQPDLFTMNGCPIAVSVCHPLLIAPPTATTAPGVIISGLDPRAFSELLTDSVLGPPTPTSVFLRTQPIRDPEDDVNLAPPNIRAEDF